MIKNTVLSSSKKVLVAAICASLLLLAGIYLVASRSGSDANSVKVAEPLTNAKQQEVKTKLTSLLKEGSPTAAFDYLRSEVASNESIARECHPLLHHLGHEAYKKYGDFSKTVNFADGLCNSGYTHGVIEAHFLASTNIEESLISTCGKEKPGSFKSWQCYHGTGHGVMYYTNKDLNKSLELCEKHTSSFARKSCTNGVFMERFIVVSHTGQHSTNADSVDIKLCQSQAEKYKADCYIYAPTAYLSHYPSDYAGAFEQCQTAAESDYLGVCINGVGSQVVKDNITNPEAARYICKNGPSDFTNACMLGVLNLLVNHHASIEPVLPLCQSTFAEFRDLCVQAVEPRRQEFAS